MRRITRILFIIAVAFALTALSPDRAEAQYPIAVPVVQPAVPAVVGYSAERRGLFGRRIVYRPVVAPVAAAPVAVATPTVAVARPVVSVAAPTVTVARPVVTVARPVISVPPVEAYYAPPVLPVTTYRVPVPVPVVYPILSF